LQNTCILSHMGTFILYAIYYSLNKKANFQVLIQKSIHLS
jgi:hypothetical protein